MDHGRVSYERSLGGGPEWTFIVGRRFFAAVPSTTAPSIIDEFVARAPDASIILESLVALLPLAGEQNVDSFAVVCFSGETGDDGIPVSIIVRGQITATVYTVEGSRDFTDRGIRPWLLSDFQSVTAVRLAAPETSDGPEAVSPPGNGTGAVRGTALRWSLAHSNSHSSVEPTAANRYRVRLPSGDERPLDAVFVLGRRPRLSDGDGRRVVLIPLASSTSAVSATHLEIRQLGDAVLLTDLGSTNGTSVAVREAGTPHVAPVRLQPGVAFRVTADATVNVGDGNIIEILPVSER
ncbi:FHA domain-containing protein [Glaciibacter psychrotolerans]|uniref:FHA domain-containing protein n=1 Tax=Glaciibacter psychrotolerans TaxID=670054 RepID=A0A7Z0EEG0_9MICO|nr:FHA domain-containing protein [Leifsonia psychrotolerans]NYJ20055.1 hypothetical protein [Leifsonia psychrotolerans]